MSPPVVAHAVRDYLPRSATFIYSVLRAQRRVRPVVLAPRATNRDEFPFDEVVELLDDASPPVRAARRIAARATGWPGTLERRYAQAIREHGCVAVHAHFGPTAWPLLPARRRLGVPLLTTFYGFDLRLPERKPEWAPRYVQLFAEGDAFAVEGPHMAERLVAAGAPRERTHVVPIGLDLDLLPYRPRERGTPLVVVQVSRFTAKKGLDISIAAFAAARERLGPAELWLGGDGPLRADLERRAAASGASDAIRFLGSLSYAEYRETLARADLGIHPSRTTPDGDTEGGAPTMLLEMQAVGVPVVATRHADIPAVVAAPEELAGEDDVEALAEALVRVASLTAAERRTRQDAGRALVERAHDVRVTAARLEDLYLAAG